MRGVNTAKDNVAPVATIVIRRDAGHRTVVSRRLGSWIPHKWTDGWRGCDHIEANLANRCALRSGLTATPYSMRRAVPVPGQAPALL